MVVYIPNVVYEQCKNNDETIEEFIKTVFSEWSHENLVVSGILKKAISQITVIDDKFGT